MKSRPAVSLVLLLFLMLGAARAGAADARHLDGVRMHEAPDYTRVVFDTSGTVGYDVFTLENPFRVVIDLEHTRAQAGFDPKAATRGQQRVRAMRASPRGDGYRVVLDLDAPVDPQSFTLQPVPPYGHRLVVDLYGKGAHPGTTSRPPPAAALPDEKRDVVVAIDAGHGGEDPGAVGPGGIFEKDVALSISRKLAARLDAKSGITAVLVRTGDYYVPLRERVEIARQQRADLFVSVHADAFKSPSVSGGSVFILSDRGATSETARWLAEKENRSDLIGGVGAVTLGDKDDVLAHVLLDLSMDANRSASIEAGSEVLRQLGSVARLHKAQVEQAGFAVLKSPDIPSLLIETGFISNPDEARRLNTASYQEQLARALADGIGSYMRRHAPHGTLLAWQRGRGNANYTVGRGDTLSGIAARHGISTSVIQEINDLRGDRIHVGQTILIPGG